MMTTANEAGTLRRIWRNRPLRFTLIGAVSLLFPAGCIGVLNAVSPECLKTSLSVSENDLPGAYRGPDGMRVTLHPNGRVEVKNWPYDLFEDGDRRFDGRGGWYYGVTEATNGDRIPQIDVDFDEGTPANDVPSETQHLYVGGTPEDPVVFDQDDPDSCPDAEFRR
ncbi:hypothetical protein HUT19_06830 [Streptomyces sp. NA02950]|uniref:hypothetical protein n=1 Tax=Streptomyces sp. NA02950 TaxID=2742137 RepID=UPI0015926B30|nr:hypothetical protein [Streptomyces sp. NA02950]QKV91499.1 hypothetical protein HUT19_06830 [Streptomyces sp. NA02950]